MRRSEPGPCIVAVVVAYRPEPARFARVLQALRGQVDEIVVVDNAQGTGLDGVTFGDGLERIDMHGNAGIGAAQNAGLRQAFAHGASHALLLDHDSVSAHDMVAVLFDAWQRLAADGQRIAAVGANPCDPRRPGSTAFVRIVGARVQRVPVADTAAVVDVSYLIGSGSLISAAAFQAVGPMEERLFIDYVDTEWGLRAGQRGWRCYGVAAARLDHTLGDEPVAALGTTLSRHSPLRNYYIVRNMVWLARASALPLQWKWAEGLRSIGRAAAWVLLTPPRGERLRAIWRGLRDGLRGRLGAAGG
jgi:rhamnosyltransferase